MSSATVFDNCISVIKTAASYSVKTCSSAEAAVLLSNLVQISLGKKYPAILKAIPYYREVEPMLLSIIVLGIAEYINHPQSAKLSKVARYAIQGEMQRLVRPLVGTARSLIEDLISTQEVEDLLNAVDGMPVEPEETA